MPKTSPADEVVGVPPADAPPVEAPAAEAPPDLGPEWGNWRYTGPPARCYTAVPVTPEPGDVVQCWGPPAADGHWEATDAEPTRMPDNWRPDPTDEQHAKLRGDKTN